MRLNPFRALRPPPEIAAQVACVPYDVVNRDEAASLAAGNPRSFLHVARPDIDLPANTDPYDASVYAQGRTALDGFLRDGTLLRDADATVYIYRQEMNGRGQTGVVASVHVDDYENDIIRKHEKTRKDKEDDRTRHVLTLDANAEPVFLAYRPSAAINADVAAAVKGKPLYDFVADDGVRHIVWKVTDPSPLLQHFAQVPLAYVADGHHRSASAWRAGQERRKANPKHTGNEEYNWFLAVLFPSDELAILPYNRVVKSLNGHTPAAFRDRLAQLGRLEDSDGFAAAAAGIVRVLPRGPLVAPHHGRIDDRPSRPDQVAGRVAAAGAGAGTDPGHRRPSHRQADRLRGRHSRRIGAGAQGDERRDGARHLDVPDDHGATPGGVGCGRDHAAEEHVV